MPNMMDYLLWRGDLTVSAAPWNDIDTLICASVCYIELEPYAADAVGETIRELADKLPLDKDCGDVFNNKRRKMMIQMADSPRYRDITVRHYVNRVDAETQFSAQVMDVPDGPRVVAFRGTDTSLTGWKEDCCMSFETVPAQLAAVDYLQRAVDTAGDRSIIAAGHSKGGNLAAYAAAHLDARRQALLTSVMSFDGPGLDDETMESEGYERIRPILSSVIPQGSIVGLLMTYHPDYKVVQSDGNGILQHDTFTWQLNGPAFALVDSNNLSSQFINETIHEWIAKCSPEQRRNFVACLFDTLEHGNASTLSDLSADKLHTIGNVIAANREMDPEARKQFFHMLGQLAAASATNVVEYAHAGAESAIGALEQRTANLISNIRDRLPGKEPVQKLEGQKS